MKNYLFLFCLTIFCNSCQSQDAKKFEKYRDIEMVMFPEIVCDFYMEKGKYPKTKQEFELYLDERVDGIFLKDIIKENNYGFKKNQDSLTLDIYDWGWDNDNDKLESFYSLDSLFPKRDGDLLLYYVRIKKCEERKRKEESIIKYFSKGELIEQRIRLNHSKVVKDFINKSVVKDYDPDDVYVPKDTQDFRRISILHYKLETDKNWKGNLLKSEHQENFNQLIPVVTNFLNESDTLKKYKIDEIILPITYYEADQLEKLYP